MRRRWITALVLPATLTVALSSAASASATAAVGRASHSAAKFGPVISLHTTPTHWFVGAPRSARPNIIPTSTSPNWSGYADTGHSATNGDFSNIAGNWNVPEIPNSACPSGNYGYRLAATWIGLDGDGDKTVEQTGTTSQCHDGTLSYYAWYEMYPLAPVTIGGVSPGDHISAYVDYTGSYWLLTLIDNTAKAGASYIEPCPSGSVCDNYSAEVIAEAPGGCKASSSQVCNGSLYPLADFNYVVFSDISVATDFVGGGIGTPTFKPVQITMKAGATVLAKVTTAISKDGFRDTWEALG